MENYAMGRKVFRMEHSRIFHVKVLFFPIHILKGSCLKIYNIKILHIQNGKFEGVLGSI